ncbi:MAG: hypothetical protein RLN62_05370 [Rickettsiales bacterium]
MSERSKFTALSSFLKYQFVAVQIFKLVRHGIAAMKWEIADRGGDAKSYDQETAKFHDHFIYSDTANFLYSGNVVRAIDAAASIGNFAASVIEGTTNPFSWVGLVVPIATDAVGIGYDIGYVQPLQTSLNSINVNSTNATQEQHDYAQHYTENQILFEGLHLHMENTLRPAVGLGVLAIKCGAKPVNCAGEVFNFNNVEWTGFIKAYYMHTKVTPEVMTDLSTRADKVLNELPILNASEDVFEQVVKNPFQEFERSATSTASPEQGAISIIGEEERADDEL